MQKQVEKTFSLKSISDQPWMQQELDSVSIITPQTDGLSTMSLILNYDAIKDRKLREAASYRYIIKISLERKGSEISLREGR